MYVWKATPKFCKAVVTKQYWKKKENVLIYEIGFRNGNFLIYTEEDNKPCLNKGVDLNDCGCIIKIVELSDTCWQTYTYENCNAEDIDWVEDFLDDYKVKDLKSYGWNCVQEQMIIKCELNIEKVNNE